MCSTDNYPRPSITGQLLLLWMLLWHTGAAQQPAAVHEKYRVYIKHLKADTFSINRLLDYSYDLLPLDSDSSLRLTERAAQLSNRLHYDYGKGRTASLKGMVYSDRGLYDSAIILYQQALVIFNARHNDLEIGKVYNNMANVYHFREMLQEAMEGYLQSAAALERASAEQYLAAIYTNIANVFQSLKQYRKGLTYTDKAEAIARQFKDTQRLVNVLISRSVGQHNLQQPEASYQSTLEAMRLSDQIGYLIGSQVTRQNLADDLTGRKEYDSALYYLRAAEPLAQRTGDPYYRSGLYMTYARVYADLHRNELARDYALKVIEVAQPLRQKSNLATAYDLLTIVYARMNNAKASNEAFKYYRLYNDSVRNEELATKVNALETRFRTLEKDKAIKAKELTLAQKDLELKKKNTWIYLSLGGILVLLVAGGWAWMSYRQKQLLQAQKLLTLQREHEVSVLQAMMQGEEQERRRIARDLHDGVGSMLSAVRLKMDALGYQRGVLSAQPAYHASLALLKDAAVTLRETAHNLQPLSLQEHGLYAAVEAFCERINGQEGLIVECILQGSPVRFHPHFDLLLYRTIQELINNVIKHAGAAHLLVQLSAHEDLFNVTVEDDGNGFDVATLDPANSMGIAGLRGRLAVFGGTVQIDSSAGGTSVMLDFVVDPDYLYHTN